MPKEGLNSDWQQRAQQELDNTMNETLRIRDEIAQGLIDANPSATLQDFYDEVVRLRKEEPNKYEHQNIYLNAVSRYRFWETKPKETPLSELLH